MFFNQPFRRNPNMIYPNYFQNIQSNRNMPCGNFITETSAINRPFENTEPENKAANKINSEFSQEIYQFMQNEKNAVIYYDKLAEKTNIDKNKKILYSISQNAAEEVNYARKLCTELSIEIKEPQQRNVNTSISFRAGIALALEEENKALGSLSSMLENNGKTALWLTPIILRKLSRVNNLYLIRSNL